MLIVRLNYNYSCYTKLIFIRRKQYLDRSRTRLVRDSKIHGVLVITSSALTSNQRGILVTHLVPRCTTIAAWVSDGHGMVARWGNHHRDSQWFTMWINEILPLFGIDSPESQFSILTEPIVRSIWRFNINSLITLCKFARIRDEITMLVR